MTQNFYSWLKSTRPKHGVIGINLRHICKVVLTTSPIAGYNNYWSLLSSKVIQSMCEEVLTQQVFSRRLSTDTNGILHRCWPLELTSLIPGSPEEHAVAVQLNCADVIATIPQLFDNDDSIRCYLHHFRRPSHLSPTLSLGSLRSFFASILTP